MNNGFTTGLPPAMKPTEVLLGILDELGELAGYSAQCAAQSRKDSRRARKGATLRPGADTPLWSAVVEKARPHLRLRGAKAYLARVLNVPRQRVNDYFVSGTQMRGAKANLARVLNVPRQRVNDYFVSGTQMPDAERMLQVLLWLTAREAESRIPGGASAHVAGASVR
jgi:hypothetical protein